MIDVVHLENEGKDRLANNFIYSLNDVLHQQMYI